MKVGWTYGRNGRERLIKRADVLRVYGRRGRTRLRWEDSVERFGVRGRGVENESKA